MTDAKQTQTTEAWLREQGVPSVDSCVQERDWCARMTAAADEIEKLKRGLRDVRKFLEKPEWGQSRYMEGSDVYDDKDSALFDIRYALGESL